MANRSKLQLLFTAAVAIQSATCVLPFDFDPDRPGARRVGRMSSNPTWGADSRTVYFSDRENSGITSIRVNAVDVLNGRTRRLATVTGLNHGEQLRMAADPAIVYASIAHPDWSLQLNVYRIPAAGGAAQVVASNVGRPWFEISASGNRIAYPGPRYDSDTVHVVPTGPSDGAPLAIPSIGSRPRAFALSPAGSVLLYQSSSGTTLADFQTSIYLAPVDGGTHRLVHRSVHGESGAVAPQVHWLDDVPHLLIATDSTPDTDGTIVIQDLNGVTGERTFVARIPSPVREIAPMQLARSRDGRSFAAWIPIAIVQKTVEGTAYKYRLYVQTPDDTEPRSKLEWTSPGLTWFEFSPDGSRLGLIAGHSLYVVQLTR